MSFAERPEVRGALALSGAEPGYTSVVDGHMLVVAVPFSRADEVAGVARVALPLTEVDVARAELYKTARRPGYGAGASGGDHRLHFGSRAGLAHRALVDRGR